MHRCRLFSHNQGIYLDEYRQETSDKTLRRSSTIILRKYFLTCCKAEFAFLSIWDFFHKYSWFTEQQGKRETISVWLALSVWLLSVMIYIFNCEEVIYGTLRVVSLFTILTIAHPLILKSLLGNTRVTTAKCLGTFS